jgi:hypothetical protein
VTASISPNPATGTASSLTIRTAKNSPRGTYTLTITGASAGVPSATTSVTLIVN